MINAILIDDEPESLQVNASLIHMFCPNVSVTGAFTDPFEGLEVLKNEKPDVVLLDIAMPGLTGLELLRRLPAIEFEVIFITAHNEFAMNAIKLSALDYLLKPVDPTELEDALKKVEQRLKNKRTMEQLEVMTNLMKNEEKASKNHQQHRIALPTFDSIVYVEMADIIRIEADGGYCDFHLANRKPLTIAKNIKLYEQSLDRYDIMRTHRSFIANLRHVVEFVRHDGGWLKMSDGSKVEVSQEKKKEVLKRLEEL